MRALIAFDKFKEALSASEACALTAETLRAHHPDWQLDPCPLADGGDGFCIILTRAAGGAFTDLTVTGPFGQPVRARYGLVDLARLPAAARAVLGLPAQLARGRLAVVELASASGLALTTPDQRDPWRATTRGVGELLRHATDSGATALLLGVGGSITHDLGLGALSALGLGFFDRADTDLAFAPPATWDALARIEGDLTSTLPPLFIACDVTNPLLGPQGAATIYAPQKGLRPEDLPRLEAATVRAARLLLAHCDQRPALADTPGAGAAGGIAFGLLCAANAHLVPGEALVSAWLDLDARLAAADLVITGEGRFDDSSLAGKGPGALVRRALALGKTTHVFAGSVALAAPPEGLHLHAITPPGTPLAAALAASAENLRKALGGL